MPVDGWSKKASWVAAGGCTVFRGPNVGLEHAATRASPDTTMAARVEADVNLRTVSGLLVLTLPVDVKIRRHGEVRLDCRRLGPQLEVLPRAQGWERGRS